MPQKKPAPNRAKELLEAIVEAVTKTGPSIRGVAVNNALMMSLGADLDDPRVRRLREYLEALIAVPLEHADGVKVDGVVKAPPIMTHEELVTVLLAGALFVQSDRILGRTIS